jgi:hypothetical protein
VGVPHRGADIRVPHQLLHCHEIDAAQHQPGGERFMAEAASSQVIEQYGADERIRTADLRITNANEDEDESD